MRLQKALLETLSVEVGPGHLVLRFSDYGAYQDLVDNIISSGNQERAEQARQVDWPRSGTVALGILIQGRVKCGQDSLRSKILYFYI